jgi:hypothetical protein
MDVFMLLNSMWGSHGCVHVAEFDVGQSWMCSCC